MCKKEMTAVEYLKEWKRMCAYHSDCTDCPFEDVKEGYACSEWVLMEARLEEAISVVQKWAEENPVKTLMDDFFEKYPNAPKQGDGSPRNICPEDVGFRDIVMCTEFPYERDCAKCWAQPLEG